MRADRLRFAYNTNGLQSHRLEDALDLIADSGYAGVALTFDHMHLDPLAASPQEARRVRRALETRNLQCGVETGARFLLDPKRKHRPTLIEKDALGRAKRLDMLSRCVELAGEIGAKTLTFASGPRDSEVPSSTAHLFLQEAIERLSEKAQQANVALALEPEPGHEPATLAAWRAIRAAVPVALALDVTHLGVEDRSEPGAAQAIRDFASELAVVHLADCPRGVHDHRPLGEGELSVRSVIEALAAVEFTGLVCVELSRHSHAAHELVPRTLEQLRAIARAC